MNIKELSVGDWVMYRNREWQVCSLYQFTGEVGLWRNDSQICENVADLTPIPLTPEILEKNGCLHTAENRILCDWFDGRITVRKYNNREWYELFVGSNQMKFKLMFVHQLQHTLRLAGIDKEIEV